MAKFRLTKKAVDDLSIIGDYTYKIWSKNQADKYYHELIEKCEVLATKQNLGKNYAEINSDIIGFPFGQHIVFYRILNKNEIEIPRFLHSKMDLKNRLQE